MGCVVITGANRGIGLELCKLYVKADHQVYGACRQTSKGLTDSGAHVIEGVDVSAVDGIEALTQALHGQSIDMLINHACILNKLSLSTNQHADLERQLVVNEIGTLD